MKQCPNCGAQLGDEAKFCSSCGKTVAGDNSNQTLPSQPVQVHYENAYDHTAEFDAADISENKVFALLPYLLGIAGIIVAVLCAGKSAYTAFHIRQRIKMTIISAVISVVSALLCWTLIVPFAGFVCLAIIFVLDIIQFFSVCSGKAKEVPIIRDFAFLK